MTNVVKVVLMLTVLVGCGDPLQDAADSIGAEANRLRESASDAGVSGDAIKDATNKAAVDVANEYVRVRDNLVAEGSSLKDYFTERNMTGEDFQNFTNTLAEQVGAEANVVRRYFNDRGLRQSREGDIATTRKVEDLENSDAETKAALADLDTRVSILEALASSLSNKLADASAITFLQSQLDSLNARLSTVDVTLLSFSDGKDGKDGINGTDGVAGINGEAGEDGTNGVDGDTGPQGSCASHAAYNVVVSYTDCSNVTCHHSRVKTLTIPISAVVCPS